MARERIRQGAMRLDEVKIMDPKARALPGQVGLLRYGSKRVAKISVVEGLCHAVPALEAENKPAGSKL
jgi:hypothetical protein